MLEVLKLGTYSIYLFFLIAKLQGRKQTSTNCKVVVWYKHILQPSLSFHLAKYSLTKLRIMIEGTCVKYHAVELNLGPRG